MLRVLVGLALLASMAACGSSSPSQTPEAARCSAAKKAVAAADEFLEGLQAQEPSYKVEGFYRDLAREKVDTTGFGIVSSQQMSFQLVSDSPLCFSVGRVAVARRSLNIIDPAMVEATRLLMAAPAT